jgi:diguanylate cyclase (GGDEF)-like protein
VRPSFRAFTGRVLLGLVFLPAAGLLVAYPARFYGSSFAQPKGADSGGAEAVGSESVAASPPLLLRATPPGARGQQIQGVRPYVAGWHTLKIYALGGLVVFGLTFAEWRWMIARQRELRALVEERTRELEVEKAELLRTKAVLAQRAVLDSLTGLFNRDAIFEVLEHEVKRARQEGQSIAVVLTDLDHFKRINDTYGHLIGDDVLREFARRIRINLRACDNVGRFGGEELLVLMPAAANEPGTKDESNHRIRELHRRVTQEPFVFNDLVLRVTCSFGVAWFPGPGNTVEALLSRSDQALYAAKALGRDRVEVAGQVRSQGAEQVAGQVIGNAGGGYPTSRG